MNPWANPNSTNRRWATVNQRKVSDSIVSPSHLHPSPPRRSVDFFLVQIHNDRLLRRNLHLKSKVSVICGFSYLRPNLGIFEFSITTQYLNFQLQPNAYNFQGRLINLSYSSDSLYVFEFAVSTRLSLLLICCTVCGMKFQLLRNVKLEDLWNYRGVGRCCV